MLNDVDTEKLHTFCERIEVAINDLRLLKEALTHRSYLNESDGVDNKHNERLEFLGDAVLELITTEYLFQHYPHRPEGELTSFRAALVRTESLAEEAGKLGYGDFIYMSKGEEATGGRERPYILANTFESVLGAIYLDQGLNVCIKFVNKVLLPKTKEIVENRLDIDPKSKLQEIAQEELRATPTYDLINAEGPDHDKIFTMAVIIKGQDFGHGQGRSKQEAEQKAAAKALKNWLELKEKIMSAKITSW